MNRHAVLAIFRFEMSRFRRTLWQSLVTPVLTTSLYFVVFGAAIGSRMSEVVITGSIRLVQKVRPKRAISNR